MLKIICKGVAAILRRIQAMLKIIHNLFWERVSDKVTVRNKLRLAEFSRKFFGYDGFCLFKSTNFLAHLLGVSRAYQ